MRPTADPMAATAAEDAADDDASFEIAEIVALRGLRLAVRVPAHLRALVASGHLVMARGTGKSRGSFRRARRRLAIRSGRHARIGGTDYIVMRRGSQTVRLPFA